MKHETRGAIVLATIAVLYVSAVTIRRATKTPTGQTLTEALGKEASEILRADAVALVPATDDTIEVWPKGSSRSESLPNRLALARWLCSSDAPKETAVVMLGGLPLGRGRLESAASEGRLAIEVLRMAPIRLECASQARFFSLEIR